MSDETTLLSCPFCGGEAETITQWNGTWEKDTYRIACSNEACPIDYIVTKQHATEAEAIAAWNTRTHGMLTAKQVRRAIFAGSAYASYDGCTYHASGINMQEVTDELNVVLGGETCGMKELVRYDGSDPHYLCLSCGHENYEDEVPTFCPSCGKVVER